MQWSRVLGATVATVCLAGCAGYESVDAEALADAVADVEPEVDPEQYRISVEIPVGDVVIDRGGKLDVDALLDERTAFAAADFHLREVVLVARSRRGGSAELRVDEWASGAVDIPEGDAESWYEVRIPAADVGEAGADWVVDFTGALHLNLLVAVLEPRSALLAAETATVREVVVDDASPAAAAEVEPTPATPTVVQEVAVVEQPVYRTKTVYRYVDRPIYRYRVSWIYDPARYYVFRDYGGWTYRYFPGTWDWRCYNLSFRLPVRHHYRGWHRHRADRADRKDGRRYDRRDRRGDRDLRDRRGGDSRNRDRRGGRGRAIDGMAVVSRPSAVWRRVHPTHPRVQLATRRAAPRMQEGRRTNPRLRASQGAGRSNGDRTAARRVVPAERPANPRLNPFQRRAADVATNPGRTVAPSGRGAEANQRRSTHDPAAAERNARIRSFERVEVRRGEPRAATDTSRRPTRRPRIADRIETSEPRPDSPGAETRPFQRRPEQRVPATTGSPQTPSASARTTVAPRSVLRRNDVRTEEDARRSHPRTRGFQREAEGRNAARTVTRPAHLRRTQQRRPSLLSTSDRQRSAERERGNARTRAFQRRSEPRVVEPPRPQSQPRSTLPRQASNPPAGLQRALGRTAPQRERPQRASPKPPQNDSRPDEVRRSDARSRAFERR